jgi:hypothetical protein
MRSDIHLPVTGVMLLTAALFQDMIPVVPWLPVKIGFLTSVALYNMISRPFFKALVAVVWAGVLTDALGGLPLFCTTAFLLLAYALVHLLRSVINAADLVTGIVLCAGFAPVQMVWTRIWAGSSGTADLRHGVALFGYSLAAGAIAGATGFFACLLVDKVSGCIKPVKAKNGFSWTEAD